MWPDRMERDRGRNMRYDERWGGGESYRPAERNSRSRSRSRIRRPRSRSRNRSPRLTADTWVPQGGGRHSGRYRSRSPPSLRRSRSPPYRQRQRMLSPPRNGRPRSPYGPSWRSRSPYSQQQPPDYQSSRFSGDSSRPSYPPRSPRRDQLSSPPGRYRDFPSPSRSASIRERSSYGRPGGRSRSPYSRNERYSRADSNPGRTRSPVKPGLPDHPSSHNSAATSRRSSPPTNFDRRSGTPSRLRSRSPADHASKVKPKSAERTPVVSSAVGSLSSSHDTARNSPLNNAPERPVSERLEKPAADRPGLSPRPSVSSEKVDQPKGPGFSDSLGSQQEIGQSAASGTPSSSAQNRATNISLLSAPTRPKGASNYHSRDYNRDHTREHSREPTWAGRRAPPPLQQTPPTGPRNRYVQPPPANDLRGPAYRPSNGLAAPHHQRSPRPNYLATLPTIVAGGRLLPPTFDISIEKRLAQLESDEDKLVEQMLDKQRSKRLGLKDWDRLERESALNALKSELAEMHLQRMTEGEGFEGATVF